MTDPCKPRIVWLTPTEPRKVCCVAHWWERPTDAEIADTQRQQASA